MPGHLRWEVEKVHPRVCGGNRDFVHEFGLFQGTSPRVRGKRTTSTTKKTTRRYIPACAGETVRDPGRQAQAGVHPRVCGGNLAVARKAFSVDGTSPRVRGKLLYRVYERGDVSRSSVRQFPPDDV